MYGPVKEKFKKLVRTFSLEKEIIFTGEIPYAEVGEIVRSVTQMHLFHFSRYETFGCVIC